MKLGNRDLTGADFRWIDEDAIAARSQPADALYIERREYGPFIGRVAAHHRADRAGHNRPGAVMAALPTSSAAPPTIARRFARSSATSSARSTIDRAGRLALRRLELETKAGRHTARADAVAATRRSTAELEAEYARLETVARRNGHRRVGDPHYAACRRWDREGAAGDRRVPRLSGQPAVATASAPRIYASRLWEFLCGRSARIEHRGRHLPGDLRHDHDGDADEHVRRPVRRAGGALPARIRPAGILRPRGADRRQQPGRRAIHRLRRVRARFLRLHRRRCDRPDVLPREPADADVRHRRHSVGVTDARTAHSAGRDRCRGRGARGGPAFHARGVAGLGGNDVPDLAARGASGRGTRHPDRVDPRDGPGRRGSSAA